MTHFSRAVSSLFLVLMFCSGYLHAKTKHDITIGVSFSIPPWVIQEKDAGIELDILRAALEQTDYNVKLLYAPFSRVHRQFELGKIDGFINAKPGSNKTGYLSDIVVTFQNVAISLKKKDYPENINFNFLQDKHVVAFQRARDYLGDEFAFMAETNQHYREVANQQLQINLLFIRGIDFIVMDKSIFGYFWHDALNNHQEKAALINQFKADVTIHPIFPKSDYAFRFIDKPLRDVFNRGLQRIKQDGTYTMIFNRYDKLRNLHQSPSG